MTLKYTIVFLGVVVAAVTTFTQSAPLLELMQCWGALRAPSIPEKVIVTPPHAITALGRIEPESEVIHLSAPAFLRDERVGTVLVKAGKLIHKGDTIAVMDNHSRLSAELAQAEKQTSLCRARLNSVTAGAKQAEIDAQKANVQEREFELEGRRAQMHALGVRLKSEALLSSNEFKRYENLYKQGAVSEAELDSRRTRMETAFARLEEADAERKRIEQTCSSQIVEANSTLNKISHVRPQDIDVARAELDSALASADRIRCDLELSKVRSPADGHVLKVWAHPGEKLGEKGIADIGQTSRMVAKAEVFEADLKYIKTGQAATIRSQAFDGKISGNVSEIGWRVCKQNSYSTDPSGNFDNRVVEVKILLDPESSRRVQSLTDLQVEVRIERDPQMCRRAAGAPSCGLADLVQSGIVAQNSAAARERTHSAAAWERAHPAAAWERAHPAAAWERRHPGGFEAKESLECKSSSQNHI